MDIQRDASANRWTIRETLLSVWALALAAHVLFSWDLGALSFELGLVLFLVPLVAWLAFGGHFASARRATRVALVAVILLYVAGWSMHLDAHSYIWRHEGDLMAQANSVRRGEPVESPFGLSIRSEQTPFRVYWPKRNWGLGSAGLVHDPQRSIGLETGGGSLFGEFVMSVRHLRGPWYLLSLT